MSVGKFVGRYSKFIAALLGVATEIVNLNVLPAVAQNDVSIGITILTALSVFGVPNTPKPTQAPSTGLMSTASQTSASSRDPHAGLSGPKGVWPTVTPKL